MPNHPHHVMNATVPYATSWPTNVAHAGLSQCPAAIPNEMLHPQPGVDPSGLIFGNFTGDFRTSASHQHLPLIAAQPASPVQTAPGFCATGLPPAYSFMHPALLAAFAAQQNAVNSRSAFCLQPSPQTASVRNALLSQGFQFAGHPATRHLPPGPLPLHQAQGLHAPLHYIQTPGGMQLAAAFPNTLGASHTANSMYTLSQVPQPQPLAMPSVGVAASQYRNLENLKTYGGPSQSQNIRRNKSMTVSKTNLYISGLSESDTDDTVRALVEEVIRPKSCKAMIINGRCKGSGFIDCSSEEDAIKAHDHLAELSKSSGKKLIVKYALENEKDLLNVYVRNLPRSGFTKETLENLFKQYGQITSVKLLETDGVYTGIGFVRFVSAEQAQRAVENMNEARCVLVEGSGIGAGRPVMCKLADKADPKRRAVATANTQALNMRQTNPTHPALSLQQQQQQQQSQQQQMSGFIFPPNVLPSGALMSSLCPASNMTFQGVSGGPSTCYRSQPPPTANDAFTGAYIAAAAVAAAAAAAAAGSGGSASDAGLALCHRSGHLDAATQGLFSEAHLLNGGVLNGNSNLLASSCGGIPSTTSSILFSMNIDTNHLANLPMQLPHQYSRNTATSQPRSFNCPTQLLPFSLQPQACHQQQAFNLSAAPTCMSPSTTFTATSPAAHPSASCRPTSFSPSSSSSSQAVLIEETQPSYLSAETLVGDFQALGLQRLPQSDTHFTAFCPLDFDQPPVAIASTPQISLDYNLYHEPEASPPTQPPPAFTHEHQEVITTTSSSQPMPVHFLTQPVDKSSLLFTVSTGSGEAAYPPETGLESSVGRGEEAMEPDQLAPCPQAKYSNRAGAGLRAPAPTGRANSDFRSQKFSPFIGNLRKATSGHTTLARRNNPAFESTLKEAADSSRAPSHVSAPSNTLPV